MIGQEMLHIYKIPLVLGGVSLFCIAASGILLIKSTQTFVPIEFISSKDTLGDSNDASVSANPKKMIRVDVEGGVRAPGLYELSSASNISDAIAKAGGLSDDADGELLVKQINQESIPIDGMKIYIPIKGERSDVYNGSYNITPSTTDTVTSYNILISVNSASENELDSLPGVGPATAEKIIKHRPYTILEELVSKKAIGNALFEKIKEKLTL